MLSSVLGALKSNTTESSHDIIAKENTTVREPVVVIPVPEALDNDQPAQSSPLVSSGELARSERRSRLTFSETNEIFMLHSVQKVGPRGDLKQSSRTRATGGGIRL